MTRVILMNSSMMPSLSGAYISTELTFDQFCTELRWADEQGTLKSFIGYPQNVQLIKQWTGVTVELNREQVTLWTDKEADIGNDQREEMLVMRLKYRPNVADKGTLVHPKDFEFAKVACYMR